jgi:hypothetical protein
MHVPVVQQPSPVSSSHEPVWIRPSIATCWPLPRNSPQVWASRSQESLLVDRGGLIAAAKQVDLDQH